MPMRKNEKPVFGPWKAERWTFSNSCDNWVNGQPVYRWRNYNRPHHHIHSGEKYEFAYLAKNLKEANECPWDKDWSDGKKPILRMRNVETGDILPADIL